jgi:hypothetical protein
MDIWNSTGRGLILYTKCSTRFNPSLVELLLVHIVLPQFQSSLPFLWKFWQSSVSSRLPNPHIPNKPFLQLATLATLFLLLTLFLLGTLSTYFFFCESLPESLSTVYLETETPKFRQKIPGLLFKKVFGTSRRYCKSPAVYIKGLWQKISNILVHFREITKIKLRNLFNNFSS